MSFIVLFFFYFFNSPFKEKEKICICPEVATPFQNAGLEQQTNTKTDRNCDLQTKPANRPSELKVYSYFSFL